MADEWAAFRVQQQPQQPNDPWAAFRTDAPNTRITVHPEASAPFDERFNAVSDEAAFRAKEPPKKFGLEDTWPAKIAKSVYKAVTLPGDVLAGNVAPESDEAIGRSFDLAGVATPLSAANKVIPKAVAPAAQEAPSIAELKAAASSGYQSPEVTGVAIKPPAISGFSQTTQQALNEAGIDANLAPKTFGILANLQKVPDNSVVTGLNIQSLRRMFGHAASSTDPTERMAAKNAIEALDSFLPNVAKSDVVSGDIEAAAKTLETARGNYSAAKHAETIDNKAIQAELRAAAANSGTNVANTVRQRMADILLKPAEQKGFTKEELAAMEKIVRGTRGQNILRAGGNLLGGGGGLGAAVVGGVGGLATPGGVGALAPIVGYTLKSLSNKMTLKQADQLSEMIRSRAPLASAAQKFEEKAAAFDGARNSKTIAAVALAARNFSTNLKSAGLNISTSDLMGGLQMSGIGRADNQPDVPRPPGQ